METSVWIGDTSSLIVWRIRDTRNATNGNSESWSNTSQSNNANNRSDWDYNAQKKQQQEEVDRILDKIRKSGYDSLTKDEKQKLFDSSKS